MDYYSHTLHITNFSIMDIYHMETILKSGYLLSRNNLKDVLYDTDINIGENTALFNGMDYISLCDLSKIHEEYSAYNMYVKNGLSLLFNKKIKVIEPTIVNIRMGNFIFGDDAHKLGMGVKRYSDLSDEVQVKDKLSLDYLEMIMLSLNKFYRYHNEEYLIVYLKLLKDLLLKYEKNIPIINLDTEREIKIEKNKIKNY